MNMIQRFFGRFRKEIKPAIDMPEIIGECEITDWKGMGELFRAGLMNPKFKWVEAIGKPTDSSKLQVLAHTLSRDNPK